MENQNYIEPDRIFWVDLIKIIAIVLIVLFHVLYELNKDLNLRPMGFVGVSLFFIASGYILTYKYNSLKSFDLNWFGKRYLKIASLYYPALLVIALLFGIQVYEISGHGLIPDLFLHFSFTNWFFHDTAYSIISPAWFLVPLIALYLFFPYINRFVSANKYYALLLVGLSVLVRYYAQTWTSFSPLYFVGDFALGIALLHFEESWLILFGLLNAVANPLMVIPTIIIFILYCVRKPIDTLLKIIDFIGRYTFEIFLFHESLLMILLGKWNVFGLSKEISFVITIICFFLTYKISKTIQTLIQKK